VVAPNCGRFFGALFVLGGRLDPGAPRARKSPEAL
jgi:hypothetical protein